MDSFSNTFPFRKEKEMEAMNSTTPDSFTACRSLKMTTMMTMGSTRTR